MLVMDVLISPPTHLQGVQLLLYPFGFDSAVWPFKKFMYNKHKHNKDRQQY